jgi:hypothetical protein
MKTLTFNKFLFTKKNFNIISKISKKCFNQDNIMKLTGEKSYKEIKFNFENKDYSVFFEETEKLSDIANKIQGCNEKIQKVEFFNYLNKESVNVETNFNSVIHTPLKIQINGLLTQKYLPTHETILNDYKLDGVNNPYNLVILRTLKSENPSELRKEILEKLDNLTNIYQTLLKECNKSEEIINKRVESKSRLYMNLGILYFLLHLIVFYLLIYQFFGWDTIEPVTYIVGNCYWILGLLFFIRYRRKLDISYFYSSGFTTKYYSYRAQLLGYSRGDKEFVSKELNEILKLRNAIDRLK